MASNQPNTNEAAPGTASTAEHVAGILTGGTLGYILGGGAAAVGTVLFPPLAPVFLAMTPGVGALIGGWAGHKATTPQS